MGLQEVGWVGMDWIDLVQDGQVAGACECSYTSSESVKWGGISGLLAVDLSASQEGLCSMYLIS